MANNMIDPRPRRKRHTAAVFLLGLAVVIGFALVLRAFVDVTVLGQWNEMARPYLMVWRFALFAVIFGAWPYWIRKLAQRRGWETSVAVHWLNQRWRLAAWAIAIELVLVQNAIGHILRALSWS